MLQEIDYMQICLFLVAVNYTKIDFYLVFVPCTTEA